MSVRRIFLRRSSASEWASENPILSLGEPGFDYTNEILKIGNGVDQWSALAQFQDQQGRQAQRVRTEPMAWTVWTDRMECR